MVSDHWIYQAIFGLFLNVILKKGTRETVVDCELLANHWRRWDQEIFSFTSDALSESARFDHRNEYYYTKWSDINDVWE